MGTPIEAETVGELLRKAADEFGDAEAVVGSGTRLTFNQLNERSRAMARHLLERGVAKGMHVGVSFGNNPDFIVTLLGVARIGAIAVPISTFAPGRELLRLIRYGDMAAIVTKRTAVGIDQYDRLTTAVPGLAGATGPMLYLEAAPCLRWIEFLDADDSSPAWATRPGDSGESAVSDALLDALEANVVPTDIALMIHTSGTTSDPKGVPHLHDSVCFRGRYMTERMRYERGERVYTSQVLFWIGGLTMSFFTCIAAGATAIWSEKFDATEVLDLIERERINRLAIYPHQTEQLLAHPKFAETDRSSLRYGDPRLGESGQLSIPLTPEGHRMALGMSETFGPYSWGTKGAGVIGAIEMVQPGLEVRLVDENNVPVADGEMGEIILRGRCVTPGYYKRPKLFGFDADGWFHTGDRGLREGDAIHFLGRLTEMIKTSGANVAPAEVIEALLAIDGVREAYVLPVADEVRGELVAAAVVADDGAGLDAATVKAALKADLSNYKIPSTIAFFKSEEIPWTPTFMVRRGQLTEMIVERAASAAS
ncbi:MAG: class I adenylate-forming enzyme family protein [Acidimicrobiia bacterium]